MTFPNIYATLKTYGPLPQELPEQTDEIYAELFKAVTRTEQVTLNACKQKAHEACGKLKNLGKGYKKEAANLCDIAISNLVEIRDRQQIFRYFEGLGGDLSSFRSVVSKFKDPTIVRIALPYKDQFDCPHTRLNLLYFLQRVLREEQEAIVPFAVSILTRCLNPDHVIPLFGLMADIQEGQKGRFLQELSSLVVFLPSEEWHALAPIFSTIPAGLRSDSIRHTISLLPQGMQNNPAEVKSTLQAVSELWGQDNILALSKPLTLRCLDGCYIATIVRHIAAMRPDECQDVVERVPNLMIDAQVGILIYETLRKLSNLAPLQRDWVQRGIEAVLGDYSREDSKAVLRLLDQVPPPPTVDAILQDAVVIPDEDVDRYFMTLARQDLYENSLQLLHNLVELFRAEKKSALQITFLGEPAKDDGGPGQEFISILVTEVCKKLNIPQREENGLFRPCRDVLTREENAAYEALGELFMFLLHSRKQYVIGQLFAGSVFVALSKLTEDSTFENLFSIYEQMNTEFTIDRNAVSSMKSAPCEDVMTAMMPFLIPCMAIKRGMVRCGFKKATPEELISRLQGSIANEFVVSQLHFDVGIPAYKEQWIREWLLQLSQKKLQSFLYALTGGRSLGKKALFVKNAPANVNFHTCDNPTLEVPFTIINSPQLMIELLEGDLEKFTNV